MVPWLPIKKEGSMINWVLSQRRVKMRSYLENIPPINPIHLNPDRVDFRHDIRQTKISTLKFSIPSTWSLKFIDATSLITSNPTFNIHYEHGQLRSRPTVLDSDPTLKLSSEVDTQMHQTDQNSHFSNLTSHQVVLQFGRCSYPVQSGTGTKS